MFNHNESLERVAQLERQRKLEERRELNNQRKADVARRIKIGELVEIYFPEVLELQPKFKKVDTEKEFAPLADFLSNLASEKEVVERLKSPSNDE
jgi:hypothetical protein